MDTPLLSNSPISLDSGLLDPFLASSLFSNLLLNASVAHSDLGDFLLHRSGSPSADRGRGPTVPSRPLPRREVSLPVPSDPTPDRSEPFFLLFTSPVDVSIVSVCLPPPGP